MCSTLHPKKIASSVDKEYWAKGTGFGTGSTASSYNMVAIRAKHKSEEKYVSICFAILSEYFSWNADEGEGEGGRKVRVQKGGEQKESGEEVEEDFVFQSEVEYCTVEVVELLRKSCLLPALAAYLLNDSGIHMIVFQWVGRNFSISDILIIRIY